MKEELIQLETAQLAKEKGFTIPILLCYHEKDRIALPFSMGKKLYTNNLEYISAPTQSLLQKWLREKHNIYVQINSSHDCLWGFELSKLCDEPYKGVFKVSKMDSYKHKTYEKALEKGLVEGLNLIP